MAKAFEKFLLQEVAMARTAKRSVKSMTGFGRSTCRGQGCAITVEASSRNGQILAVNTRVPEALSGLGFEMVADAAVRKSVERGTVLVAVRLPAAGNKAAGPDLEAARNYASAVDRLMKKLRLPEREDARWLATLPGVVPRQDAPAAEAEKYAGIFAKALRGAIDAMIAGREREGNKTRQTLLALLAGVERKLKTVADLAPAALAGSRERMLRRVRLLLDDASQVSEADIAREISLLADKMDIAEEVARLWAHVGEFKKLLAAGGSIGRGLEFLVQEMQRESSTMSAKANDAPLVHCIIDIKTGVKQLKELVQNLE
ncbi:MAG: YicC/YloC family endoribonuclease [Planctomycetota bacterium]|nr:YicC/YloC family endoribonuclease [Planctomycetota bacterium]